MVGEYFWMVSSWNVSSTAWLFQSRLENHQTNKELNVATATDCGWQGNLVKPLTGNSHLWSPRQWSPRQNWDHRWYWKRWGPGGYNQLTTTNRALHAARSGPPGSAALLCNRSSLSSQWSENIRWMIRLCGKNNGLPGLPLMASAYIPVNDINHRTLQIGQCWQSACGHTVRRT